MSQLQVRRVLAVGIDHQRIDAGLLPGLAERGEAGVVDGGGEFGAFRGHAEIWQCGVDQVGRLA